MTTEHAVALNVGGLTDTGRVREHNEDTWLCMPDIGLVAVADGMGGHASGDVASRLAVTVIEESFAAEEEPERRGFLDGLLRRNRPGPANRIEGALARANEQILQTAESRPELKGMGTTIVAMQLPPGSRSIHWAHVGDSRIYNLHAGVLRQLTSDHSLLNEYLRLGLLQPEQAAGFPYKNIIVRALGLSPGVEIDVGSEAVEPGDRFLLCSDGLSDLVPDDHLRAVLLTEPDPQQASATLVEMALDAGGLDNVTAVVADVREGGGD